MEYKDLEKMLRTLDDTQLEVVSGFASKISSISSEKLTGEVSFNIKFYQGGITQNIKVHRSEELQVSKKRRVRSKGI